MIARAKKTDTGKLIFPEDAPQTFTKGDFVCPYCEVPLTPVMPEDESKASFWRIYPGQEHLLGYCRTISEKEGLVHSAAATKEAKFFLNDKRPEKGYPYAEASSAADLLESEAETLTGNAADDLFGSDEEEEHTDDVRASVSSEAEGLITAAAELDESLVGQSVIIHHAPERKPRVSAETVVSQLSQLYDENFHESPLSTPMFGKTRGDYMILPATSQIYLNEHNGEIKGFLIISCTFSGYSIRDKLLLFELFGFNEKTGRSELKARIEMQCDDEKYYDDILLQEHFVKKGANGRFVYRYSRMVVWLRGRFSWKPREKCSGCKYRDIHDGIPCGSCSGLITGKIKTSTQILFTNWITSDGKRGCREQSLMGKGGSKWESVMQSR